MSEIMDTTPEKTFTLREFFQAIRDNGSLNGIPQGKAYLFEYADPSYAVLDHKSLTNYPKSITGPIAEACAFGHACINLGIDRPFVGEAYGGKMSVIYGEIWHLNDLEDKACSEIADIMENRYKEVLDDTFTVPVFDYTPYLPVKV